MIGTKYAARTSTTAKRRDYYWATETDPDQLKAEIHDRIHEFFAFIENTNVINRKLRTYKYYHNIFFGSARAGDTDIKSLGEDGELVAMAIPELRSLLNRLHGMATRQRPQVDCDAKNTDRASLLQSRYGRDLLNDFLLENEEVYKDACLHALIFDTGYVYTHWDKEAGEEINGDPMTGQVDHQGDVAVCAPHFFDVVYDPRAQSISEVRWCMVRRRRNKWDLAMLYPEGAEDIIEADIRDAEEETGLSIDAAVNDMPEDTVSEWTFYHLPTPSVPFGRYVVRIGEFVKDLGPMPYRWLPLEFIQAGQTIFTCLGHSPANDLHSCQEGLNAAASTNATNIRAVGVKNFWIKEGDSVSPEALVGGLNIVQSMEPPQVLDPGKVQTDVIKYPTEMVLNMERIIGINSVTRGQPEGGLRGGSGAAFALLDSKSLESADVLIQSYYRAIEKSCQKVLQLYDASGETERYRTVAGIHGESYLLAFKGGDFGGVAKVRVKRGNPMLQSPAGRFETAKMLLEQKHINVQQFFTFLLTGNIDPMLEAPMAQLMIIRQENERMIHGTMDFDPLLTDDHKLHCQEHGALLNTVEIRQSPVAAGIMAHILNHAAMMGDLKSQMISTVFGYDTPLPPNPMGAPGGKAALPNETAGPGQAHMPGEMGQGPGGPASPAPPAGPENNEVQAA